MKTIAYIAITLALVATAFLAGKRWPDRAMAAKLAESHRTIEEKDSVIAMAILENHRTDSLLTEMIINLDQFRAGQDSLLAELAILGRASRDRVLKRLDELEALDRKRTELSEMAKNFDL